MTEITINDTNAHEYAPGGSAVGGMMHGLIPRDFAQYPVGYLMCARRFDLPLIPESEWQSRLDVRIAAQAQLSDVRKRGNNGQPIPSRDQNGRGYCWFHSGTSASLICRTINNEPYLDFSAYMGACLIKNYRDQGGWGSEGVEFIASTGVCTSEFWPQQSVSRSNDTPEMRNNAALHKFTEWRDLDPDNMKAQLVTCLLMGFPVVSDFNWWRHSVCTVDLVSIDPFKTRIWNSWGDSWSDNGMGLLEGRKAIPDGALVCLTQTPSVA